jgi:hypothetical protein
VRVVAKIDWIGNATFAVGLIALLTGIVYSLLPYGGHPTGWTNPWVLAGVFGGIAVLGLFVWVETKVPAPMFHLELFRIRAFVMGNVAGLMAALGRGGLQFMLVIWLQGIWLPQHGYSFDQTPLWAGIYMIPLTLGFFLGPFSGSLVGPLRFEGVDQSRLDPVGIGVPAARVAADELQLRVVRSSALPVRDGHGPLLLPEPGRHHEQPPTRSARRRGRHDHDVLQLGHRAVHGPVLHDRDPRPGCRAAVPHVQRADGRRHQSGRGHTLWPTNHPSAASSPPSSATTPSKNCSARPAPSSTFRPTRPPT